MIIDEDKLKNEGKFVVAAYFTIAQNSIDISQLSGKKKRKMLGAYPGRDSLNSIPSYLIGQLGRCDAYSGKELSGQQILEVNESNETPGILTNPPSLYIIKYILVYTIQKEEQA